MPTAVDPGAHWMHDVARRLERALGWPVTFDAPSDSDGDASRDCWHADIQDGIQKIGRLTLQLPDDPRRDAGFTSARELTDLMAEVLSRLATAARKLDTRSQDISTLVEIGKSVPRSADLPTALAQLLKAVTQISGLWCGAFFLIDPRDSQLRLRATHQLPAKKVPAPLRAIDLETPDGRAWRSGAVRLNRKHANDRNWLPEGMAVGLGVPILSPSGYLGMLWCFDRRQKALGDWEEQVLQSVAAQIAAVLERTVLLKESEQQQQLKSDLRVASAKLPVGLLELPPKDWGLDLALRAATVTGVGGDVCDVIPLGDHRTLIAIGDAVGHSVPAAMLVSVVRGALRALVSQAAPNSLSTSRLMGGLNRTLSAVTREEQFVTLMLAIIDSQAGTLTYTNAGHPPPLLLRGGEWTSLQSHGLFLGVLPDAVYTTSTCELLAEDVLVLFTDGVTETMSSSRAVFRRQGIKATLPSAGAADAHAIAEAIWHGLEQHDPGRPLRDDRTLLVLKYLGAG